MFNLNLHKFASMKKLNKIGLFSLALMSIAACKKVDHKEVVTNVSEEQIEESHSTKNVTTEEEYSKLALAIKEYLNNTFLTAADKRVISEDEKKFSFYEIDLNNDGSKEIFIYLKSTYFCGSGGCTVLLLSDKLNLITKFTVTNTPIFAEPTVKNGWKILSIKSNGEWKELTYADGKYPGNPTVLKKASYDAPSGHAEVIFSEDANTIEYSF